MYLCTHDVYLCIIVHVYKLVHEYNMSLMSCMPLSSLAL